MGFRDLPPGRGRWVVLSFLYPVAAIVLLLSLLDPRHRHGERETLFVLVVALLLLGYGGWRAWRAWKVLRRGSDPGGPGPTER